MRGGGYIQPPIFLSSWRLCSCPADASRILVSGCKSILDCHTRAPKEVSKTEKNVCKMQFLWRHFAHVWQKVKKVCGGAPPCKISSKLVPISQSCSRKSDLVPPQYKPSAYNNGITGLIFSGALPQPRSLVLVIPLL